ncbi:uncharacterized protein B0T15DRAFT_275165 [Chaetomium strumarium]|uniref:Uncharacterized protein n=1 Tax=Chaetomium strumarium TaxID=1170767 RepID=A0AAJ0GNX9_9PEZI|nr:hypothetical protein B0T15DRAFT_275165 [Chaetomium strumarium]
MATSTSVLATTTSPTPLVITSFPTIPLTTTFTRPNEGCGGIYLPDDPPLFMIDDRPSCLPSRFSTSDSSFFYSPGIACPSGYWTACYDTTGVSSITTVTCCPTYGDIKLSCVADPLTLSSVWETLFCTWVAPAETGTVITTTERRGKTSVGTAQVTAPGGINAYGVRMVYQSTDLYTSTSTSSSSSASDTTDTAAPSTTASPGDPPAISGSASSSADSSSGLSTGAKAAIGVVIPLVVIGALILGLLFWRRRKQQVLPLSPEQEYAATAATASVAPPDEHHQLTEQPKLPVYYYGSPPQPTQPHPHEMPGTYYLPEMPSARQAAAELPADPTEPTPTYTSYYGYGK